jgi:hypothetical protein
VPNINFVCRNSRIPAPRCALGQDDIGSSISSAVYVGSKVAPKPAMAQPPAAAPDATPPPNPAS